MSDQTPLPALKAGEIYAEVPTTRRAVMNYVCRPDGSGMYTSKSLIKCLAWARRQGLERLEIWGPDDYMILTVEHVEDRKNTDVEPDLPLAGIM